MAKTPKNSATVPVALNTTAVQSQNDDSATSLSSTPSGSNGPDGINTGPADTEKPASDVTLDSEGNISGAVSAAASETFSTDASQGSAGGTGANAGSAASDEEIVALAGLGRTLLDTIKAVARDYPELEAWIGSSYPVGIVRELAEENAVLKDLAAAGSSQSSADEKRAFVVSRSLRVNGEFFAAGVCHLTEKQHAAIAAANRCDPDWENGESIR